MAQSRMAIDRLEWGEVVLAAIRAHAEEVSRQAAEVLGPYLQEDEQVPDVAFLMELVGRRLESRSADLREIDEQNLREQMAFSEARQLRDGAFELVYDTTIELKELLRLVFGGGILKASGLDGPIPRDPAALADAVDEAMKTLGDPSFVWPRPLIQDVVMQPAELVQRLVAANGLLRERLANLPKSESDTVTSLAGKLDAIDEHDDARVDTGEVVCGLMRLAGREDLADRLRPSVTRSPTGGPPSDVMSLESEVSGGVSEEASGN